MKPTNILRQVWREHSDVIGNTNTVLALQQLWQEEVNWHEETFDKPPESEWRDIEIVTQM